MFKRIMVAVAFGLMAIAAQAEATFDEIQGLIQQQQYAAAASGLETIIQNHPKSAKAFYAMAQAQAGMGNLEKANKALTIATGLNPTLDFAPASSVASLKQAITPQTAKIEAVETSHIWRTLALLVLVAAGSYFIYTVYARKQDEEEAEREARYAQQREDARKAREAMEKADAQHKQAQREAELAQQLREQAT
jgi:cytochrome c-type biogenesis protein CcmH/NrfG